MFGIPIIGEVLNIAGGVVGVVGVGVGVWKKRQLGKVVKEVFDVIEVYRKSRNDNKIDEKEMDNIIKELEEAVLAIVGIWKVK